MSDIPEPKYAIGEVCYAVKLDGTKLEGEILERKLLPIAFVTTGGTTRNVWGYQHTAVEKKVIHGVLGWISESSLRKKYPPADDSFEDMMSKLKTPQLEHMS